MSQRQLPPREVGELIAQSTKSSAQSRESESLEKSSLSKVAGRDRNAESVILTPRAFSIDEFCRVYAIGRTAVYEEIGSGRLRAVKRGRRTLITRDDAEAWLARLPAVRKDKIGDRTGEKNVEE